MENIHFRNRLTSKCRLRSVMFVLCLLTTTLLSFSELRAADTKTRVQITGVVTDTGGLPVPGASVVLHGTTIGISTDTDGKFKLEFDDRPNIIIDVSFIGMKKQ